MTWGGSENPGDLAAHRIRIDHDDLRRARDASRLHGPETEVTGAEDRDALADPDLGRRHHRSVPGQETAAVHREHVIGHVGLDRPQVVGREVHVLRVAADVARALQQVPVAVGRDLRPPALVEQLRALVGTPDAAVEALAALRGAGDDDLLPDREFGHRRAHRFHLRDRRVPQDRRWLLPVDALDAQDVGAAEGGCDGPHEHAPGFEGEPLDVVLDDEGGVVGLQHGCTWHGEFFLVRPRMRSWCVGVRIRLGS